MKHIPASAITARSGPLQPGGWFLREGRLFQIIRWDSHNPLHLEAQASDARAPESFVVSDLFASTPITRFAATAEALTRPTDAGLSQTAVDSTLPRNLLDKADKIIHIVEKVTTDVTELVAKQRLSLSEATRHACLSLDQPIGMTSFYKFRGLYERLGADRARIAAALRRNTLGKSRIHPQARHFVDVIIQRFFKSNPPLRTGTVYAIAEQLWLANRRWWVGADITQGALADTLIERLLDPRVSIDDLLADPQCKPALAQIPLPSRAWFYEYTRWLESTAGEESARLYVTRHGQAEWDARFMVFDQFAVNATLPLQQVFADHYQLDVLHVDDVFREDLGRLWLTVLIDAFSRCVVGMFLAHEAPRIESIQGALRHAIWPKSGLQTHGIDLPWMAFGIPQRLSLDNAWAHHSHSLEDLARALSGAGNYTHMELVFRPPYKARYGGLVERLFGNLSGQIREQLPGAALNANQRHWHNASQEACLLYADIQRLIHQLVVDYMHTPHTELSGQTPHQRWVAGMQLMMPVPPPLTPQLERQFWRLLPSTRQATGMGLNLFGMHYWGIDLKSLRANDKRGQRRAFNLRFDPANISRVAVFESGRWLGDAFARELRLPDGRFATTSLWELRIAKSLARMQTGRSPRKTHSWLIHLLEARELIAQRQSEKKTIRRKIQQLSEHRKGRPALDPVLPLGSAVAAPNPPQTKKRKRRDDNSTDPRSQLLDTLTEVL